KMSDMDGVSSVEDICLQAFKWGMPGIAITDHAVTQALSIWSHFYKDKGKKYPGLEKFKVIPGVEGYLVDDYNQIVINEKGQDLDNSEIVVFDIETTGLSPIKHRIIEIGAVKLKDGEITERFSEFINPETPIPPHITRLTSIMDEMVCDAPTIDVILPRFVRFCEGAILVGHNVTFDIGFINQKCKELGLPADFTCIDTMGLSRAFYPEQAHHHLDAVCKKLGVTNDHHHRAISDAECTAKIFAIFLKDINDRGINDLSGLHALEKMDPKAVSRMRSHHIIILAKNSVGRTNLYTLISLSHLNYFYRTPKIPRSELMKYREGLIIGSACCMGELYDALLEDRLDEEIASIVNFYDYLEIQPRANNKFMIGNEKEKFSSVNSEEDILNLNRRIVKLGEQYNKPVVATCDAHFLNPEDEIYRRVIMTIKNMTDEEPAPLYVRTT
ncbi:exonuclease, DNA polymerase III, epsilon subunit family, partial [Butyrivibrio sp. ob235]|uniref:exonuclease domain-containing protein n=1 Tax=Butyrivibrio sp. ob235 TaxID=1761780 RepID=UPI0008BA0A69